MTARSKPGDDLTKVLAGLALLWLCFVGQLLVFHVWGIDLTPLLGVVPRERWGLIGILTAPLLHGSWPHLIANCTALLVLGFLARRTAPEGAPIAMLLAMLCGGLLAWMTGPAHHPHIGASGIAFGLIGFLLVNGLVRGGCGPVIAAVVVAMFFSGALLAVLDIRSAEGARLSWQMHVGGLIGGALGAWVRRHRSRA
jgi:membrane associated rhomboid family serine protease